jgi:hypothetical protein
MMWQCGCLLWYVQDSSVPRAERALCHVEQSWQNLLQSVKELHASKMHAMRFMFDGLLACLCWVWFVICMCVRTFASVLGLACY